MYPDSQHCTPNYVVLASGAGIALTLPFSVLVIKRSVAELESEPVEPNYLRPGAGVGAEIIF